MAIKPIEKIDHAGIMTKIALLGLLIGVGFLLGRITPRKTFSETKPEVLSEESVRLPEVNPSTIAQNLVEKSKDVVGEVLGTATDVVGDIASNSATAVSEFIIDKTTAPFIDQINKLPPDQREQIKKNICE
jgi:hypothetical protein